jgi:hypothetical protein
MTGTLTTSQKRQEMKMLSYLQGCWISLTDIIHVFAYISQNKKLAGITLPFLIVGELPALSRLLQQHSKAG